MIMTIGTEMAMGQEIKTFLLMQLSNVYLVLLGNEK